MGLALLLAAVLGCCASDTLPSPVVRVDLRDRLPPELQRQIVAADTSRECSSRFRLEAGEAAQAFFARWRVLDAGEDRYVTTVEIDPDGPTSGATAPKASAAVGPSRTVKSGKGSATRIAVHVTWSARQGCSELGTNRGIELAADDPSCPPPSRGGKLLTPVD